MTLCPAGPRGHPGAGAGPAVAGTSDRERGPDAAAQGDPALLYRDGGDSEGTAPGGDSTREETVR